MTPIPNEHYRRPLLRLYFLVCAIMVMFAFLPAIAYADTETKTVRVGYYENEVEI